MHKLIICHWSVLAWRFTFGECPWQGGMLAFVFCWSKINYNKILGQGSFDSGVYKKLTKDISVFTESKIHKPNCNFKKQNKSWQTERFKLGGLVCEETCFAFVRRKQQCLKIQLGHRRPSNKKGFIGKSKANSSCVQIL